MPVDGRIAGQHFCFGIVFFFADASMEWLRRRRPNFEGVSMQENLLFDCGLTKIIATPKRFIAALVLFSCGTCAFADQACNEPTLKTLGAYLKMNRFFAGENGRILASACKVLPNGAGTTAAAIIYRGKFRKFHGTDETQVVALIDHRTFKVIAAHDKAFSNGILHDNPDYRLGIDTARYHLSDDAFVFGIDFFDIYSEPVGCLWDGGIGSELTLFAHDKRKTLRPILTMLRSEWTYTQCVVDSDLPHMTKDSSTTLAVARTKTNGYADLEATVAGTVSVEGPDDRLPVVSPDPKRRPLRTVIRYDGKQYDIKPYEAAKEKWFNR